MAFIRAISGGGGSQTTVTITPNPSYITNANLVGVKSGNTITITGSFECAISQVPANSALFTVSPAPSTEQTANNSITKINGATRNAKIQTNGQVILLDTYILSGDAWNVNLSYTV